jgi:aminoglycoside/choline kinase family phosphotransferase
VLELDTAAMERWVAGALGHAVHEVQPMPGGAGTRRYFRVRAGDARAVVMFVPDAAPEEAGGGAAPGARWPFLEVQALLAARGVRVPAVLAEACADGLCLLEDLGDDTLGRFVAAHPEQREAMYRGAMRDLAAAQCALAELPPESIVASRAFDETLLRWELDHFREWGLDARDRALGAEERAELDAIFDRLARRIAAWPRGFVHRDYQSTNLLVVPSGAASAPALCWIDFQDALLGPRVYDLVALLNDSYLDLDRSFVEARLDDFAAASGLGAEARAELGRQFDLMTVQRKLKDAGRFVFIDRVKKNPAFLRFLDPSLAKVRRSLTSLADDADMRALASLLARA